MTGTIRTTGLGLSRRQFIVTSLTATGGFALGIAAPDLAQAATLGARPWGDEAAHAGEINAWIVIEPDDSVIIRYGRAEMGQGSFTALPMIVTEELECDWAKVKPEYASANRNFREKQVYGTLGTGGSRAVRETRAMLAHRSKPAKRRTRHAARPHANASSRRLTADAESAHSFSRGRDRDVTLDPHGRRPRSRDGPAWPQDGRRAGRREAAFFLRPPPNVTPSLIAF